MKKKDAITLLMFTALMLPVFLNACKLFVSKEEAFFNNGTRAVRQGDLESAEKILKNFESEFPRDQHVLELKALISSAFLEKGNFDKAQLFARQIPLQGTENHILAKKFEILGDVSAQTGNIFKAAGEFVTAIEYIDSYADTSALKNKVGILFQEKAKPLDLERIIESYGGKFPADEALFALGKIKASKNDIIGSRKILERLKEKFPDNDKVEELKKNIEESEKAVLSMPVVGCILPFSGSYEALGEYVKNGILTAQVIHNERIGKPLVEVIFKDSEGDPQKAVSALNELAKDSRVVAIIGPLRSPSLKACAPLADKYRIPLISPTADADYITGLSDYIYRNCLLPEVEAENMAEYAVNKLNKLNIGVLYTEDYYGKKLAENFAKRVEKLGGNIRIKISYAGKEGGYIKQVEQLKTNIDSEGIIDALYLPGDYDKVGLIVPQLIFYNINNVELLGSSGWDSGRFSRDGNPERLLELVDNVESLEGAVFTDSFSPWSNDPETKRFIEQYNEIFSSFPNTYSAQAYDVFSMIIEQVVKGGGTRDDIKKQLSEIGKYKGISGVAAIGSKGKVVKEPFFIEITNGKFEEKKVEK